MKAARSVATGLMTGFGWVSVACLLAIGAYWVHRAPAEPNEAAGLIYAHNEHGRALYLSAFQSTASSPVFLFSSGLIFLIGVLLAPRREVRVPAGDPVPSQWRLDWRLDANGLFRWSAAAGAVVALAAVFGLGPYLVAALNRAGLILH